MIESRSPGTVPVSALIDDVGDPEQDAGGGAEQDAVPVPDPLDAVREQEQGSRA